MSKINPDSPESSASGAITAACGHENKTVQERGDILSKLVIDLGQYFDAYVGEQKAELDGHLQYLRGLPTFWKSREAASADARSQIAGNREDEVDLVKMEAIIESIKDPDVRDKFMCQLNACYARLLCAAALQSGVEIGADVLRALGYSNGRGMEERGAVEGMDLADLDKYLDVEFAMAKPDYMGGSSLNLANA